MKKQLLIQHKYLVSKKNELRELFKDKLPNH